MVAAHPIDPRLPTLEEIDGWIAGMVNRPRAAAPQTEEEAARGLLALRFATSLHDLCASGDPRFAEVAGWKDRPDLAQLLDALALGRPRLRPDEPGYGPGPEPEDPAIVALEDEAWRAYGTDFERELSDIEAGRHPYQVAALRSSQP